MQGGKAGMPLGEGPEVTQGLRSPGFRVTATDASSPHQDPIPLRSHPGVTGRVPEASLVGLTRPCTCTPSLHPLVPPCSRGWGLCLDDPPSKEVIDFPAVPPGVLYDVSHQCRLQYGAYSAFCDDMDVSRADGPGLPGLRGLLGDRGAALHGRRLPTFRVLLSSRGIEKHAGGTRGDTPGYGHKHVRDHGTESSQRAGWGWEKPGQVGRSGPPVQAHKDQRAPLGGLHFYTTMLWGHSWEQ